MAHDNQDSLLVVLMTNGAAPNGWTALGNGLIARRVTWANYRDAFKIGLKVCAIYLFQYNSSGSAPFKTELAGNDDYAWEHDPSSSNIRLSRHNASGGGAGTQRTEFTNASSAGGSGGGASESWGSGISQVPMLGSVMQDGDPSAAQLAAARAIQSGDIPLGLCELSSSGPDPIPGVGWKSIPLPGLNSPPGESRRRARQWTGLLDGSTRSTSKASCFRGIVSLLWTTAMGPQQFGWSTTILDRAGLP